MAKKSAQRYSDFIRQVGHGKLDNIEVTHDGYPLSVKEAKFIDIFIATGSVPQALAEAKTTYRNIIGKDYIVDEVQWRLAELKKKTIADAEEIMQYYTKVLRNEEKDQFGLDAPLAERTAAAKELMRRLTDIEAAENGSIVPEVKVTLDWGGEK